MEARLQQPRIPPLSPDQWSETQARLLRPVFEQGQVYNNLGTLAQHAAAFEKLMAWGGHVIAGTTLSKRDRELVILRAGFLCRSQYVWTQHVVIGLREGLTQEEIDRIQALPSSDAWSDIEYFILKATDEIIADHFVTDETWTGLSLARTKEQIMDIIYAAGTYAMMASALNSLGVQLDASFNPQPDTSASGLSFISPLDGDEG